MAEIDANERDKRRISDERANEKYPEWEDKDQPEEKYTKDKGETFEGKAHPGKPLEPDELEESPPEFSPQQGARQEKDVHPTSELSSTPRHSPGPSRTSGKHPTSELDIRSKNRRR